MKLSATQTAALLDGAPDAIVIADQEGQIVLLNTQAEALFGYARAELLNEPIERLLPARFREAHVRHRAGYTRSPKVRPMGALMELYARRKDGSEFPVEISLSPLQTDDGLLISSAIRDVSERKAAEHALIDARSEAERANRAKSAFLAAASHDLRQPLQTLSLLNSVLARTALAGTKEAEIATIQAQAVKSMSDLLNSLLDISKLEAGVITPDVKDCEVRAILENCRAQFAAQAESKGLELLLDDCDNVVRTDPTLLEQIVQNLVSNAIRYTERGIVQLQSSEDGTTVHIRVRDTGPGIPGDELEVIFEEFYQVPRAPGKRKEGLGLGLSIVRRMADLLGHSIAVESKLGEGSCFSIRVPKGKEAHQALPAATAEQDSGGPGGVILIVDDETAVAHATSMLLEIEGYHAVMAASFDEVELWFGQERVVPDLVICDFHLAGGEQGGQTIARIRHMMQRTVPAVLITGDTSEAMMEACEGMQDCHLLSKPVNGNELLALVQRVIGRSA